MKISDVLKDIEKLKGMKLKSIRKGAEIIIDSLDWESRRIFLITSKGSRRSRPFIEIERLWKTLCTQPAIHVDSELGGSGSSRNQPETILANLPYIEWFRHAGKKHLVYVATPSHSYGTLKRMDVLESEKLRHKLFKVQEEALRYSDATRIIIVSEDLKEHAEILEDITGIQGMSLEQGVYEFSLPSCKLLLTAVTSTSGNINPGTYVVLPTSFPTLTNREVIDIGGSKYKMYSLKGCNILYPIINI